MNTVTPTEWLSVAAAAARMDVHVRTIERRAAAGKLTTRRAADGTVQIELPSEPSKPTAEAVADVMAVQADRQIQMAGAVFATSERELATVRDELTIIRTSARHAWRTVAVLAATCAVAGTVGVWWSVTVTERLRGDLRTAEGKAAAIERLASDREREADRLRLDLDAARQLSLAVAAELRQSNPPPDTRPAFTLWPSPSVSAPARRLSDAR